ncbi:DUF397 domain-containing protein [Streptomyces sp. V2]|uniref:DUF397 domain-containing protein n=1 Tax=Streptomyces niveiscabiei TaxID=164115 RepID=A0ABW9HL93_9ACTN|nr:MULTISPECIES: DUF397 domain-containing protein [Streptomyces]PWG09826.1 DUF397 domain-containing protein [Streptomyces sp. V2]
MNSADLTGAVWRKSTRSNSDANCVEVAVLSSSQVAARDTKHDGYGPALVFTAGQWTSFIKELDQ